MSVVKLQIIYVTFKFQNLITDSVNMQIYHYDSKQLELILALDKRFAINVSKSLKILMDPVIEE